MRTAKDLQILGLVSSSGPLRLPVVDLQLPFGSALLSGLWVPPLTALIPIQNGFFDGGAQSSGGASVILDILRVCFVSLNLGALCGLCGRIDWELDLRSWAGLPFSIGFW